MAQLKGTIIDGQCTVKEDTTIDSNLYLNGYETTGCIKCLHPTSDEFRTVLGMSGSGNLVIGYSNYTEDDGNTHIYGKDIKIYSSTAGTNYKPYLSVGEYFSITCHTAGLLTNSSTDVYFVIPVSRPIIGSPTVTITGTAIFRQDSKYTHGSSASTKVTPRSINVNAQTWHIGVNLALSDTTNAVNNAPIGISFYGTITLS